MAQINGREIPTVNIKGKEYPTVATRIQVAHNGVLGSGFSMVGNESFSLADRHFVRVTIAIGEQRFSGTAEIHFGLSGTSADATNPYETAETSAIGRALGFAGFIIDTIASADEMVRAGHTFVDADQPRQLPAAQRQPTPAEECAALGHELKLDEKEYRVIVRSYTHDGKVNWQSVKSALETKRSEASLHDGHMEQLHSALAAHPAD